MLTLIAESKTMAHNLSEVKHTEYECHKPKFETKAIAIHSFLQTLSQIELSERLGISATLAIKTMQLIYDFPYKNTGITALDAFTGEVFKALKANSLSTQSREHADRYLLIVSSLYGLLKPSDIIKPYRLDYNKDCSPSGTSLMKYWKPILSEALAKQIQDTGEDQILNLLPEDASKLFDWSLIKKFAKVDKVEFKTISQNGEIKTPATRKLKELRGIMTRHIIEAKINSFKDIISINTKIFYFDKNLSRPGHPVFVALD